MTQKKVRLPVNNYMPDNNNKINADKREASLSEEEIEQVISDALKQYLKASRDKESSETAIDAMVATCQEFMKSFIILGYDFDGNPVEPIVSANNQQDADSLSAYLQRFLMYMSK